MHGDGGHSHFRFGSISWRPGDAEGEVEFTIRNGWRRSAYHSLDFTWPDAACVEPSLPGLPVVHCSGSDGHPEPGDVILEGVATTAFETGDGRRISSPYGRLLYLVTSVDRDGDWLFAGGAGPRGAAGAVDDDHAHLRRAGAAHGVHRRLLPARNRLAQPAHQQPHAGELPGRDGGRHPGG